MTDWISKLKYVDVKRYTQTLLKKHTLSEHCHDYHERTDWHFIGSCAGIFCVREIRLIIFARVYLCTCPRYVMLLITYKTIIAANIVFKHNSHRETSYACWVVMLAKMSCSTCYRRTASPPCACARGYSVWWLQQTCASNIRTWMAFYLSEWQHACAAR